MLNARVFCKEGCHLDVARTKKNEWIAILSRAFKPTESRVLIRRVLEKLAIDSDIRTLNHELPSWPQQPTELTESPVNIGGWTPLC